MVGLGLVFQWHFLTEVDWKKGPRYFAAPPIKRWSPFLHLILFPESGLSHLTCFGQWDIDKHVSNRGLKNACDIRVCLLLLQLESWGHHMKKHTLAFWKGHIKKNLSTLTGYLPTARHVSGAILDPLALSLSANWLQTYEWAQVRISKELPKWTQHKLPTHRIVS